MKKILIIIAFCLCLIAVGILGTSCLLKKIANNAISNTVHYKDESKYSIGNFSYNAENVDKIEINWIFGDITLVESDSAQLNVTEDEDSMNEKEKLRYFLDGRTLKIQFWKSNYIGNIKSLKKDVTIEVPRNIKIQIDQVSGNIEGENLDLRSLDLDVVSGRVHIQTLKTYDLNVDSVSGFVKIGSLNAKDVSIDSVSGNVDIGLNSGNEVEIETVSGSVDIKLNGLGATIDFGSVSGKYRQDNVFGDGTCKISVHTTSGDLHVEK